MVTLPTVLLTVFALCAYIICVQWALYLQFQSEKRDTPLVFATLFIVLALMLMVS